MVVLDSLTRHKDFARLRHRKARGAHNALLGIRWAASPKNIVNLQHVSGSSQVNPIAESSKDLLQFRVGFVVSKKVGKAVIRNRVRRRLREALWRLLKDDSENVWTNRTIDMVIIAKPAAANATFNELYEGLYFTLKKSRLISV